MNTKKEKIPTPKELEKELSQFLAKRFGENVKLAPPIVVPQEFNGENNTAPKRKSAKINFDLKPEELVAHLDQYIVKQDAAKAVLATKICTHFNRIRHQQSKSHQSGDLVGNIKNNILMLGPTGVGKTYMIRLIAHRIGVPFIKGDATKFSETGYVGGDVEDLIRDLVREADGDIESAQFGIVYIDEIDKIASSQNFIGADVSRTGVQRALLKPMEETDVDLKVPHDPISMFQEIERFRKTGKREKSVVNTKHILFIMSGAFSGLDKIIKKRIADQGIGFAASLGKAEDEVGLLNKVKSEDLIAFGFESEFIGRLPVRTVFERLEEQDLYDILANPNNPIILGKKLDFAAYGIDISFDKEALRLLAKHAFDENTGARGLVSAVERALLPFEKRLPSSKVKQFPIIKDTVVNPQAHLASLEADDAHAEIDMLFEQLKAKEKDLTAAYINANKKRLSEKFGLSLTPIRIKLVAAFLVNQIMDVETALKTVIELHEQIKAMELQFLKSYGINIVLEEDAMDHLISQCVFHSKDIDTLYNQLILNFEHGLKLVRDKSGCNRFFLAQKALMHPEEYIRNLLQENQASNPSLGENDTNERTDTP